jgi:hypothetical protein
VDNFGAQKLVKARGEVFLDLYCSESCFWAKAHVAFGPFGWLLALAKAKAGWKAQPKGP